MPKPLDYAELQEAAATLLRHLSFNASSHDYEVAILALTDIATRAFEQASRLTARGGYVVIGDECPPVLLSDACAALNAPKDSATKEKP